MSKELNKVPSDLRDLVEDQTDSNNSNENESSTLSSLDKFGYRSCRPNGMQFCNTPKWLTFNVGLFIFITGMQVTGLKASAARPLEKQFGFTSTQIGIFAAMYDVSAAILGFCFSFYASNSHKGKWTATGCVLMCLGSIITIVPHFIYGPYHITAIANTSSICNEANPLTNSTTSLSSFYLFILCLGQVVSGSGSTIIWSIGFSYIDENVSPTASPLYLGVMGLLASLGPGAGYLLGGAFLNLHVDWPKRPTGISPGDPQWIGAWWLGYVLVAIISAVMAIPLFAYPKHLPGYLKNKEKRLKLALGKSRIDNNYGTSIRQFPQALKDLINNRVFIFITLGATTEGMTVGGLSTFVPKYLQTQLNLSASQASLLAGIATVIGAAGGMQMGGVIVRLKKMHPVQIARFCYIVGIGGMLSSLLLLFNCRDVPLAGVTVSYSNQTGSTLNGMNLTSSCNSMCSCRIANYDPVCGIDGISYASSCYAGCSYSGETSQGKVYFDCSCLDTTKQTKNPTSITYDAKRGLCSNNCLFYIPILLSVAVNMFMTYLNAVPASQVILRSVPESQRCFALGTNWFVLRMLGAVPGPIIVGSIIDQSCILWNEQNGVRTFCWKYDNYLLSILLTVVLVTLKTFTATFFFMSWYFYNREQIKAVKLRNIDQSTDVKNQIEVAQL